MAMVAPRWAHSSAVSRPIPLPAPVTTTVLPCRFVVSMRGTVAFALAMELPPLAADAGIRCLPIPTPFAVGRVNCYLIEDEPLTLLDTGPNSGKALDELERALDAHGRRVEDLELIVLSHQHMDHLGLAGILARRSGAEVAGTAKLAAYLGDLDESLEADDDYAVALMRRHGVTPGTIATLGEVSRAYRRYAVEAVAVGRLLEDGGELDAGGRRWRIAERPGHSPTDTVLAADGILLAGDHLLEKISSNPIAHWPVGAPDPVGLAASPDRPRTLLMYDDALAATAAEDRGELILPGHGETFTGARELIERRFGMTERRADKILAELREPRTAAAIGRDLWRHVPVTQAYLVLSEVLGHLDLLEARGAVVPEEHDGVVVYARA